MASKPGVYLDTNIVSAYWYEGSDVMSLARRIHTRDWWESERLHFHLWVSATTINELKAGKFSRQADCVKMASRISRLPINKFTQDTAQELLRSRMFPVDKPGDIMQMAVAAAHEIDYLLTWNYAHLCNPAAQRTLAEILPSAPVAGSIDRLAGIDSPGPLWTNDSEAEMTDPIVDEVRRVREELIQRYGGLEGYLKHCEEQDRRRTSQIAAKPGGKQPRQTGRSRRSDSKSQGKG